MAAAAETLDAQRLRHARAHVVAQHHRPQQRGAARPFPLGQRQRRGHDAAAGMHQREIISVVGFIGMAVHAVGQRGVDCRRDDGRADDGRLGHAALRSHKVNRAPPRQQTRAGQHRRQGIEQMVFGTLGDGRRQCATRCSGDVFRQCGGDLRDFCRKFFLHVRRLTTPVRLEPVEGQQGFDKLSPNGDTQIDKTVTITRA